MPSSEKPRSLERGVVTPEQRRVLAALREGGIIFRNRKTGGTFLNCTETPISPSDVQTLEAHGFIEFGRVTGTQLTTAGRRALAEAEGGE